MQIIKFFKDSYNEFVHYVERPKFANLIKDMRLIALFTIVMVVFLYGIDTFFSSFLENFYSLLKKIKE